MNSQPTPRTPQLTPRTPHLTPGASAPSLPVASRRNLGRVSGPALLGAAALTVLLLGTGPSLAAPSSNSATYPLDTCIVSGKTLGTHGDVVVREYDGREVQFCCPMCIKDFEKDQASYLKKLDQAIIDAQLPDYPLQTCVVSGQALDGSMGEPVNHFVGNRLIRLCCGSCEKELDADPTSFLAKLDAAVVQAQLPDYQAEVCPISGEKLGAMAEPYDYVFAGRLVRFCCPGCIKSFDKDPTAAMAAVYGDGNGTETGAPDAAKDQHEAAGSK